jgi:hypothetical protein
MAKDKKSKADSKKARLVEKKKKQERKGEKKEKAKNVRATECAPLESSTFTGSCY